MSDNHKAQPASHNQANFKDKASISIVESILASTKRAISDLNAIDKWPNIDGYIEVQDTNQNLLGKLEAQVKTLPENHDYKFQLETSFIAYISEVAILPVILFGVDKSTKKVYWLHMDRKLIDSLDNWETQQTKIIKFNSEKYISESNFNDCIQQWEQIISVYKSKFQKYDELKPQYDALLAYSNPALGKENINFINIHHFLDEYNRLLDNHFNIVKKIYYPKSWKIGFAYYHYTENDMKYRLYPIPFNFNDIQIKEVDENFEKKWQGWTLNYGNDIEYNPKKYAQQLIEKKVQDTINNKLLNHTGNIFLTQEIIMSFIDKFYFLLGLKIKSEYSLSELEYAFHLNLQLWIEEALPYSNTVEELTKDIISVDPEELFWNLNPDTKDQIIQNIKDRISNGNIITTKIFIIQNEQFSVFSEMLEFLKNRKIEKIQRAYKPKNYSLLDNNNSSIYNTLTKEDLAFNLKIFFDNLLPTYNQIIQNNFPLLIKELSLFKDYFDTMIIIFEENRYKKISLKSIENGKQYSLNVITNNEDIQIFANIDNKLGEKINFQNNTYRINGIYSAGTDFIFDDYPMLNYIYEILNKKLTKYFINLSQ